MGKKKQGKKKTQPLHFPLLQSSMVRVQLRMNDPEASVILDNQKIDCAPFTYKGS